MKFRVDLKHKPDETTDKLGQVFEFMSPNKFKELFGITFREWKASLDDDDRLKKLQYCDAYCCIDPYDEDIHGKINPLIEDSADNLYEMDYLYGQEI